MLSATSAAPIRALVAIGSAILPKSVMRPAAGQVAVDMVGDRRHREHQPGDQPQSYRARRR